MYSLLLVALEYMGFVRLFLPPAVRIQSRSTVALVVLSCIVIAISLRDDAQTDQKLHDREQILITHLILWERHPERLVLIPDESSTMWSPEWVQERTVLQEDLLREMGAGLYVPPYSATDPIPLHPHSPATLDIEDEHPR